jgi:hypothetical protein
MSGGFQELCRMMPNPSRPVRLSITFCLLLLLLYLRIEQRITHEFWIDEIQEISNLKTLSYLLFEFLPTQPGGLPGHYLLVFPLQIIFPFNKYVLGLPGLIAHVAAFLLFPRVFAQLGLAPSGHSFFPASIARFGFAVNGTLAYQAMEVRPYSVLPLLWVLATLLAGYTIRFFNHIDEETNPRRKAMVVAGIAAGHLAVCLWHAYGVIMLASIYLFFALVSFDSIFRMVRRPLAIGMAIVVAVITVPVWRFYSPGSSGWDFDTFEYIPRSFLGATRTVIDLLISLHWGRLSIVVLVMIMAGMVILLAPRITSRQNLLDGLFGRLFWLSVALVTLPIMVILAIDLATSYWFIQRQFIWTAVPFWMATGVSTTIVLTTGVNFFRRRQL